MPSPINPLKIEIPRETREEWQSLVDTMAAILDVPAGLIMRLVDPEIEVFVTSDSEGNPYEQGDAEDVWGSGLYCETVIKTGDRLLIPNALEDGDWKNNPDVKLDMISYLGFPIAWPDGTPFGTLCVLDSKTNGYSETQGELIAKLRNLIQSQLELIHANHQLGQENKKLGDIAGELGRLRQMIPICCVCKKVREDDGYWASVEHYVQRLTGSSFSHGFCPGCYADQMAELRKPPA